VNHSCEPMRGFHGVWEAATLEESLAMMKSGSVTRLRVLDDSLALDRQGVHQIANALNSRRYSETRKWSFVHGVPVAFRGTLSALVKGLHKLTNTHTRAYVGRGCIETLWLRNMKMPSDAGHELCSILAQNSTLTELYLEDNSLSEQGIVDMCIFSGIDNTIPALANNRSLVTLCLDGNGVGERALASLADSLAVQPSLTELSLGRNPLFTSEVDQFCETLKRNTRLNVLRLNACQLGPTFPAGTMLIQGLEVLDLANNKLEDVPNSVGHHSRLRNMNLQGNTPRLQKRLNALASAGAGASKSETSPSSGREATSPDESSSAPAQVGRFEEGTISWKAIHRQLKEAARRDAQAMARIGGFHAR